MPKHTFDKINIHKEKAEMLGVSAIVATYKRNAPLKKLFDSLVLNNSSRLEVIVVDQNRDGLIDELVAEYNNALDIIHLKIEAPNQSYARNYGATHARYPLLCFPDDDCWFDDDSIAKVIDYFTLHINTDLLIINWRQSLVPDSGPTTLSKQKIFSYKAPTDYATYELFFRKEAFFRLGCFTETIGLGKYIGGGEDTELIFRTAKYGMTIHYDPSIYVNHKHTPITDRDFKSVRSRERGTGFVYAQFKLNHFVIARGFLSPLLRMVFCGNVTNSRIYYNVFMARMEGFIYGLKNR